MPTTKHLILLLLTVFSSMRSTAQPESRGNFYDSAKYCDFSKLWHTDSIQNLMYVDGEVAADAARMELPEPLGFIGDNYQRFYIHFTAVKKSRQHPYQYTVTGKTKVNNNICPFIGTITIDTAAFNTDTTIPVSTGIRRGYLICSCVFNADKGCKNSGTISGRLTTYWCLYKGQLCYDNTGLASDRYSNNNFTGAWTSYTGNILKKCHWGDYRIPGCGDLDVGAGDFSPNEKYKNNGWQRYSRQYEHTEEGQRARAIEQGKWWR